MTMRISSRLFLAFLTFASAIGTVRACGCPVESPREQYESANAVFEGDLVSVKQVMLTQLSERVTIRVKRPWKGMSAASPEIVLPYSIESCGMNVKVGETYLVYATAESDGTLRTSACSMRGYGDAVADHDMLAGLPSQHLQFKAAFSDVPKDNPSVDAITDLRKQGIVSGYADGTFRPDQSLTRAEITKILVDAVLPYRTDSQSGSFAFTSGAMPFTDLDRQAWYNDSIRKAYRIGLIHGYRDRTFRPAQRVTVAEASKLLIESLKIKTDGLGAVWYERYIRALSDHSALPTSLRSVNDPITRGQFSEMLWRLTSKIEKKPTLLAVDLLAKECAQSEDSFVAKVDMRRVREAWLKKYNDLRISKGLKPYVYEPYLNRSSALWSKQAAIKGSIDHVRDGTKSSYDYNAIKQWFSDLGLEFQNVSGMTFTENVGWGPYKCDAIDCTDRLFAAIATTFDFYTSEEPRSYRPHWNAIVNPEFRLIGLGVDVKDGKYFLTMHVATSITSHPPALCTVDAN